MDNTILELPTGERCDSCDAEMVISIDAAGDPVLACDCCAYNVA
jgi:hypothetical protein